MKKTITEETKAVIFDMDGLMFDTERLYADCWIQAGREFGVEIGEEYLSKVRGSSAKEAGEIFRRFFGEQPDFSQICLYSLLDKAIEKGEPLPRIFQCCGKQDFLYPVNLEFRDYLVKKVGNFVDLYRFEDSDGDHCWPYWNQQIQRIMKWMQEETTEK